MDRVDRLRTLIRLMYEHRRRACFESIVDLLLLSPTTAPWDGLEEEDFEILRGEIAANDAKDPRFMSMIAPMVSAMLDPAFNVNTCLIPPLYAAVWCGDIDAMRVILRVRPEIRDRPYMAKDGLTATQRALHKRQADMALLLFEHCRDSPNCLEPSRWRGLDDEWYTAEREWERYVRPALMGSRPSSYWASADRSGSRSR
jgi:hypothetical protein